MEETEKGLTLPDFGALLRERRLRKGWTEEDVAEQLKITCRLVRAIEEGDMQSVLPPLHMRGALFAPTPKCLPSMKRPSMPPVPC